MSLMFPCEAGGVKNLVSLQRLGSLLWWEIPHVMGCDQKKRKENPNIFFLYLRPYYQTKHLCEKKKKKF